MGGCEVHVRYRAEAERVLGWAEGRIADWVAAEAGGLRITLATSQTPVACLFTRCKGHIVRKDWLGGHVRQIQDCLLLGGDKVLSACNRYMTCVLRHASKH
eukprot:scaffold17449_cov19-Tisochrysis_lutea.AAC.1